MNVEVLFNGKRADFPMLGRKVNGMPFVYLDSAATSQKPISVIDSMSRFYAETYATVNRVVYSTAQAVSDRYEDVRNTVAQFVGALSSEIIFTRGATDSINILADSFAKGLLTSQSRILVTEMEHHSNIIPWQLAAKTSGATLDVIPITEEGDLRLDVLEEKLQAGNVVVVAVTHVSNTLGTVNPISEIASLVHRYNAYLVVDGAQSIAHMPIDVAKLQCDAFCFSAHKMCGPTGLGVLYGRTELLNALPATRGGSDMMTAATMTSFVEAPLPRKFEPGTPPIAEVIGLGAAVAYLSTLSMAAIESWEQSLTAHLTAGLVAIPHVRLVGTSKQRGSLQSFHIEGIHPLDLATLLDLRGIAVRSGHHCTRPLLARLNFSALTRASIAFYNTIEEIDYFLNVLVDEIKKLRG
jgi:cysteine desulfurase / selenocysteine lyase